MSLKVLCSSVIRASQLGDSHGGLYVVDIDNGTHKQILDWDRPDINWEGRGGDRGIRGMRFYNNLLYAAAGDAIFVFDKDMKAVNQFTCPYLRHTHEVDIYDNKLYIIANLYDAILVFDLKNECFIDSWHFQNDTPTLFDPNVRIYGPEAIDKLHLDSVYIHRGVLYYSGHHMDKLMALNLYNGNQSVYQDNIKHSHNAQPYMNGTIYNIANQRKTVYKDKYLDSIKWTGNSPVCKDMVDKISNEKIAVQGYVRGMVLYSDFIIVGSSPATINVFNTDSVDVIKSIQISNDVRNSICGIVKYEWEQ